MTPWTRDSMERRRLYLESLRLHATHGANYCRDCGKTWPPDKHGRCPACGGRFLGEERE